MSVKLEFSITLTGHHSLLPPVVFLLFDANRDDKLDDDKPVDLHQDADAWTWTGQVEVAGDKASGLIFRIGWSTTTGAKIKVDITVDGDSVYSHTVVADTDGKAGRLTTMVP